MTLRTWGRFAAFLLVSSLFGQSDRGTVTGTVADPGGALIPGAAVVLENAATGGRFTSATTDTGNYTIPSVPAGIYTLSVEQSGFRKHVQTGITVNVAQTARVDVALQIGSTSESVQVTADAPLLRTESAEQSTTISGDRINALPLNFAIGAGAVRNPLTFVQLSPGASIGGWNDIRVNGAPGNTFRIIFEGQDTTSALNPRVSDESQPSVEAIQEFTLQTSNFSAEFGQVAGGLFNFTSRSGTNQFHGSAYEYFAHEKLYSGRPFQFTPEGEHVRPQVRRHNFGGSFGGPVKLPKLYNGTDRTFFFANYEMFRDIQNQNLGDGTVPTEAFRRGDFSAALTDRIVQTPLGPIREGTIFDPATTRTVDGQIVRDPFPGNIIPQNRLDPVALRVQNLIPTPNAGTLVNNYIRRAGYRKIQDIPSIKIDHNFTGSSKMSFYWSRMRTDKDNGLDGLPDPISRRRDQIIRSQTTRVNFDQTISPTVLLHLGAGYQRYRNPDAAPANIQEFDAEQELGLRGTFDLGFPRFTGLSNAFGGLNAGGSDIGPTNRSLYLQDKPTAVASITMVRGNHSYKAGGEWRLDTFTNISTGNVAGTFGFSGSQTGLAQEGVNLSGVTVGHPYASFLLGLANNASISNPQEPQYRRTAWGFFVQDTWKVTRRLTFDYGIRYDLQPPARELHRRTSMFAPTVPNPNAGGLPGAIIYEGEGQGRCNCTFASTYPYAVAPRLGAAYQINDKTVLRGGWGLSYGQLTGFNYIGGGNSQGMGFNTLNFNSPGPGLPALALQNGLQYNPADLLRASYDPGLLVGGNLQNATAIIDPNGGRPPRTNQWNVSLQRELSRDLVIEAAYVGNRGAWFRGDGLINYNAISNERLRSFGLDLSRAEDRTLLTSRIDSPLAQQRGFRAPYAGFPASQTVAQAIRPYPQFLNVPSLWAPLGNSWYDSLQMKLTKRYSYGLDFSVAYTWSKTLGTVEDQDGTVVPANDVFNRPNQKTISRSDQPHVLVTAFNYQTPAFSQNRALRALTGGWSIGGILRYASGLPIRVPQAQNALNSLIFQSTNANRVPGQPLFLKDPNCHCINPFKDFILNPAAWTDPAQGQWGTAAAYYSDYRQQRRYDEQMSIGKTFRFGERGTSLSFRAEFFNIFNRTYVDNPESGNALATQRAGSDGVTVSGFGRINPNSFPGDYRPRSGQIVARLQF